MTMRRGLVLMLAAALVSASCEYVDEGLDEVKNAHGVDLRDPADTARAASGADAIGNQEAEDGLDVVKGFRRATHEANGDKAEAAGDHRKAREEYAEALRWTQEKPYNVPFFGPQQRKNSEEYDKAIARKRGNLYSKLGDSYASEAADQSKRAFNNNNDPGLDSASKSNYVKAAQHYEAAAKFDQSRRLHFARYSGWLYWNAGEDFQACAVDQAQQRIGGQPMGYCK
jgi:tetratricopeptide (TPR) repeat protein